VGAWKEVMATPTQNQAQAGPPINVLHDQNVPNTLGGIGPSNAAMGLRLPVGAFIAAVFLVMIVLAILVALAA